MANTTPPSDWQKQYDRLERTIRPIRERLSRFGKDLTDCEFERLLAKHDRLVAEQKKLKPQKHRRGKRK